VTALGDGMLIIPNGKFVACQPFVRTLDNRFFKPDVKVEVEPMVHGRPADAVIVVRILQKGDV